MKNVTDIWHFPRVKLAEQYLDLLKIGITNRITLFAPRRMGKTVFLVNDLAPLARKRKYLPIYISMWEDANEPHQIIIDTLESSIAELQSSKNTLHKLFSATVQKLKLEGNLGLGKMSAEVEFPDNPRPASSNELAHISRLFKQLVKLSTKRRPLLLLDEIQHLGSSKKFESLTYNLRTALDIHSRYLDVIFTGSSRAGLKKIFSDTKAPFYEFSDRIEFPSLGKEFVEHMALVYQKLVSKKLSTTKTWKIFKELNYNPAHMRSIVKIMILEDTSQLDNVYIRVLSAIADENDFHKQWKSLKEIDREIYVLLSQEKSIYSDAVAKKLEKKLNKTITNSGIQASIRKLLSMQLISSDGRGKYLIETPGFAQWCLNQKKAL